MTYDDFMKRREDLIGHLSLNEQNNLESELCSELGSGLWTDKTYLERLKERV